jgi:ElaB/YqjD/DUF883 family membrane-anchored ribosome-binding protein
MRGRSQDGPAEALDELTDNIRDFARTDFATLSAQIKTLQADVAALAGALAKSGIGQAEATVRGAFDRASASMEEGADRATARGEEAAVEIERLITRNPLVSLLVALGLGFLFGMVARR